MGIEAFGVSMRFVQPGVYPRVRQLLSDLPEIRTHKEQTSSAYETITAEFHDGKHTIDVQISVEIPQDFCELAVRFSLCSYDTIDAVFIDLVRRILSLFESEVWLMNSALHLKDYYLPGDMEWLIAALPDEIQAMRDYWQNLFGRAQGIVRADDSFSFVGLLGYRGLQLTSLAKAGL